MFETATSSASYFLLEFSKTLRVKDYLLHCEELHYSDCFSSVAEVKFYCTMLLVAMELPDISYHMAVCRGDYILVFGGRLSNYGNPLHTPVSCHVIWRHNLYTEQWSKHMIPENELYPPNTAGACAVAIKEYVFLFGGYNFEEQNFYNELWKLHKSSNKGLFTWCKVVTENMKEPSPRFCHSGWTHSEKLWIFGGFGPSPDGYLNANGEFSQLFNNQLLSFNPSCKEWVNVKCFGSIPSPRAKHASAIIGDTVWLYGGGNISFPLDDLYELNMSSLAWTHVQTGNTKPSGRCGCSLNAITHDQLLLHGGIGPDIMKLRDTWILDLPSQTWKQYKSEGYARAWHTGSIGINGNSIIIGGATSSVGRGEYKTHFPIMLGPRSLQQMAIQTIYTHHSSLPWKGLPKKLITLLGI